MNKETVLTQYPLMLRTNNFIKKYGVKISWIAEKLNINNKFLSAFINGKYVLKESQFNQLKKFLDEYDGRMIGFMTLEN